MVLRGAYWLAHEQPILRDGLPCYTRSLSWLDSRIAEIFAQEFLKGEEVVSELRTRSEVRGGGGYYTCVGGRWRWEGSFGEVDFGCGDGAMAKGGCKVFIGCIADKGVPRKTTAAFRALE